MNANEARERACQYKPYQKYIKTIDELIREKANHGSFEMRISVKELLTKVNVNVNSFGTDVKAINTELHKLKTFLDVYYSVKGFTFDDGMRGSITDTTSINNFEIVIRWIRIY